MRRFMLDSIPFIDIVQGNSPRGSTPRASTQYPTIYAALLPLLFTQTQVKGGLVPEDYPKFVSPTRLLNELIDVLLLLLMITFETCSRSKMCMPTYLGFLTIVFVCACAGGFLLQIKHPALCGMFTAPFVETGLCHGVCSSEGGS